MSGTAVKYVARVEQVLQTGIHRLVTQIRDGEMVAHAMPLPDYVEIHVSDHDAMLFRYRDDGTFCGDTWHEDLESARAQAEYEYGIAESAWRIV